MSFRDFDLPKIQLDFGITVDTNRSLFDSVAPVPISETLARYWVEYQPLGLALGTEKGRSEFLAAPLLAEVWRCSNREVSMLSGIDLNVDSSVGLNGVCDFVLCRSSNLYYLIAPLLVTVEANRDNVHDGLGQCAAEMIAAQRFNQKAGTPIDPMYGCLTTGSMWRFLRLTGTHLDIDIGEYSIAQPDRILGVLLHCCGYHPSQIV